MQTPEHKKIAIAYIQSGNQFKKESKLDQAIENYDKALQILPNYSL